MKSAQLSAKSTAIVGAIDQLFAERLRPITLHEPTFGKIEETYLLNCLRTGFVSSVGAYVTQFEEKLAEICGVPRAVACVNGTAALHVCLRAMDIQPGDEVLVPAITFAATVNACLLHHAIPHIVESDPVTLGPDLHKLKAYLEKIGSWQKGKLINKNTGRPIAALINVHVFGHCGDPDEFAEFAREYGLALIEDAAESIGTTFGQRSAGSWGDISATSFNGNKTITTGGGGAVLCRTEESANRVKHLTTTAKKPHRWAFDHDEAGYNYRMPNLNAALGCAQLNRLPEFLEQKRRLQAEYQVLLGKTEGLSMIDAPEGCNSNFWLCGFRLNKETAADRDAILNALNDRSILVRPLWRPMHKLPYLADVPRMPDLSVAETLSASVINLPSSPFLAEVLAAKRNAA